MSITAIIKEITEAINNTNICMEVVTEGASLYTSLNIHTDLKQASKEAQHIWDKCRWQLENNYINANINYESDLIESSLPVCISNVAHEVLKYLQYEIHSKINISQKKRKLKNDTLIQSKKWLNKSLYLTSNQEELDTLYAIYKNLSSLKTSTLSNLTYLAYQKYGSM